MPIDLRTSPTTHTSSGIFSPMKKRTNIISPPNRLKRLEALRRKSGAPMAEQIRRAIDAWLDREEENRHDVILLSASHKI